MTDGTKNGMINLLQRYGGEYFGVSKRRKK